MVLASGEPVTTQVQVLDATGNPVTVGTFYYNVFDQVDGLAASGNLVHTQDGMWTATWTPGAAGEWKFEAWGDTPKFRRTFGYSVQKGVEAAILTYLYSTSGAPTMISGQAVKISGETVRLESGIIIGKEASSGILVNIGSGVGVTATFPTPQQVYGSAAATIVGGSSFVTINSGVGVAIDPATLSGVAVQISGQRVYVAPSTIAGWSGVRTLLESGANVNIGSGVGTITTFPAAQPIVGSVAATLISGGYVNIGSGVGVKTDITTAGLSGLNVRVESGVSVAATFSSGAYVNVGSGVGTITTFPTPQPVIGSVAATLISGGYVNIGSGVGVRVNDQSGHGVRLQSGEYVNVGSGVGAIVTFPTPQPVIGSVAATLISGGYVNIGSGVGVRVNDQSGLGVRLQSGDYVNIGSGVGILATLAPASTANLSGLNVRIESGTSVSMTLASGSWVNIGSGVGTIVTFPTAQPIVGSVAATLISGGYVNIGSGVGVRVNDQSGHGVRLQSGEYVNVGSGVGAIVTFPTPQPVIGSVAATLISGGYVNIGSGVGVRIQDQSGVGVILNSGLGLGIAGSGASVLISTVANSGLPVNVGSGVGVLATIAAASTPNLSGLNVRIESGTSVSMTLASGSWVNIGSGVGTIVTFPTPQAVIGSVAASLISGGYVNVGSGVGVRLQSGEWVNVGAQGAQNSGTMLNYAPMKNSGQGITVGGIYYPVDVTVGSGEFSHLRIAPDGDLRVRAQSQSGDSLYIRTSGTSVNVTGQVSLLSGGYVNVGSGVGTITTFPTAQPIVGSVAATLISGGYVNIGSGVGTLTTLVPASTANLSGLNVRVESGVSVAATVTIGSGLILGYFPSKASGQGLLVGGHYYPVDVNPSSGDFTPIRVGFDGDLKVGARVQSGDSLYIRTSGTSVNVTGQVSLLSGGYVNVGSGVGTITTLVPASTANLSGLNVRVESGVSVAATVTIGSGLILGYFPSRASGQGLLVGGHYYPVDVTISSGDFAPLRVAPDGDLRVRIQSQSGDAAYVRTSGTTPGVSVTGQVSLLSGGYVNIGSPTTLMSGLITRNISGMSVSVLGMQSGNYVNIGSGVGVIATLVPASTANLSGLNVRIESGTSVNLTLASPTGGRARAPLIVGSFSGGITLLSGDAKSVLIKALPANTNDIYVGFTGPGTVDKPYSGYGYILQKGESLALDINSMASVSLFAAYSGDKVTYMGVI
jgi:hypothetical protein